jgi:hypothetical protein
MFVRFIRKADGRPTFINVDHIIQVDPHRHPGAAPPETDSVITTTEGYSSDGCMPTTIVEGTVNQVVQAIYEAKDRAVAQEENIRLQARREARP